METHRLDNWGLYLIALLISTVVFIIVLIVASFVSNFESTDLLKNQFENSYSIFKDKYLFSQNQLLCQEGSLDQVSKDLFFHGKVISDLEERLGKNNEQVLFQKKFYTLVLLEHLDFVNQINLKCNYSIPTILFFYSNKDETIDKNENVGNLLDHLSNKYSELKVYSFDVNLNDALIESLILRYNVNEVPTVVLGNGTSIVNPTNVDQIETYLR